MKNHVLTLAAFAVIGFSGNALAQDGRKVMTDAEMERATAGAYVPNGISSMNYTYQGPAPIPAPAPRFLEFEVEADLTQADAHQMSPTLDITVEETRTPPN